MLQHFGPAATASPLPSSPNVRPRSGGCWPRSRDNAGSRGAWAVSTKTVHHRASNIITTAALSDGLGAIPSARDAGSGGAGSAELPLPTWCQEAGVPSSMLIDDECADVTDSSLVATSPRPRAPRPIPAAPRPVGRSGCHGLGPALRYLHSPAGGRSDRLRDRAANDGRAARQGAGPARADQRTHPLPLP